MSAWKTYVVIFLSKDWYTIYYGHAKVRARSEAEAEAKARKKLNIQHRVGWAEIETLD